MARQIDLFGPPAPKIKLPAVKKPPPEKVRCERCNRLVAKVDRQYQQCASCNGEWLHEVGRQILVANLPPEAARAYMRDGE
jgi:uncharacterized protein with PIN domain